MPILNPIDGGAITALGAATVNTLLTSADAKTVYDCAELVDLWIPEYSETVAGVFGLVGGKNYRRFTPLSGSDAPTLVPNTFGSRPALVSGGATATVGDLTIPSVFPTNRSYSVVWGGTPNLPLTTQYLWGTTGAAPTYCWAIAGGNIRIYHMDVLMGSSSQTVTNATPHVHVWSYNHSTRVGVLRVNKAVGFTKTGITDPQVNTNTGFNLFARGSGGTGASLGIKAGPVMLFDGLALADAGNAALLAAAENLAYGLVNLA